MYSNLLTIKETLNGLKHYVTVQNGVLHLVNEDAFKVVVACLHQTIVGLPTTWNYDIDKADFVLEKFEEVINHNSLRKLIAKKISGLMLANKLTSENDPDTYFFPDKIMRSFVNHNFDMIIGGKIISLKSHQQDYQRLLKGEKIEGAYLYEEVFEESDFANNNQSNIAAYKNVANGIELVVNSISVLPKSQNPLDCYIQAFDNSVSADCDEGGLIKYDWHIFDDTQPLNILVIEKLGAGKAINFTFPKSGKYKICVVAFNNTCRSKVKCEWFVINSSKPTPNTPTCCSPYGLKTQTANYATKRQVRTRLLLMTVIPWLYTSITAGTRAWKRGPLGLVWWPHKVKFLSVRLSGSYNEGWCKGTLKNMTPYVNSENSSQASVFHYSFAPIYVNYHAVKSEHTINPGTGNIINLDDQYICSG